MQATVLMKGTLWESLILGTGKIPMKTGLTLMGTDGD